MSVLFTEADYENSVIELFRNDLGYEYAYGPDIERDFYCPLYEEVMIDSLYRLNRGLPDDAIQDALFRLKNFENGELVQKNAVLWTICKTVSRLDFLWTARSVPLSSILLTTKIPTTTPLSSLINGLSLRTATNARM